jgi:tungstate transport system ATP-binding protein
MAGVGMAGCLSQRSANLPIVFDEVSVAAGAVTILDRITLRLAPGAPTVVIGPNGAGKTTLLRTAMGLVAPSQGHITWGGRTNPAAARRAATGLAAAGLAIVFQRPAMLRRNAAGNIRYALQAAGVPRSRHRMAVDELLAIVGLDRLHDRPARRLSIGEQQRLALARALALGPAILFLDEPTASLDPAGTKAIEDIISDIARRGIKIVLATHDLGEARRLAGEIVLLHRGRIVETGPAAAFFAAPRTEEARRFIAGELLL